MPRPLRADPDVQWIWAACQEKENHSEGGVEIIALTKLSGVDLEFAKFHSPKVNTREPVFNETLNFEVEISDDCNNCSMIIIERKL